MLLVGASGTSATDVEAGAVNRVHELLASARTALKDALKVRWTVALARIVCARGGLQLHGRRSSQAPHEASQRSCAS
jgi:hypothetical protein